VTSTPGVGWLVAIVQADFEASRCIVAHTLADLDVGRVTVVILRQGNGRSYFSFHLSFMKL
jgi:hypothetical protein